MMSKQPGRYPVSAPSILALCLCAGPALVVGCKKDAKAVEHKPRPVRYAKISTGADTGEKSFAAAIQADDTTQLSFRVAGTLTEVKYKRGDKVKKGKLIAALDDTDYKVTVKQASAQRSSAKTRRNAARTTLNRVEKLFETNSTSLSEYQNAKSQLDAAEAELRAAGQQVAAARNQLAYTKLVAPFAGVVQSVTGNEGEAVPAGRVIAVISKGDALEVKASLPEAFISRISVGTPVRVGVSALGDRKFKGTVSEVAFASEGAAAYPVIVHLDETDSSMRPGMAATATFDLGGGPATLRVPVSAVGNLESGSFVFLLEKAEGEVYTVRKREIVLGELQGEYFAVESGLEQGAMVATAGLSLLLDGMKVRLLGSDDDGESDDRGID